VSAYFVDTSALAKRYLKEVGSNWVISWIESIVGNTIIVADFTTVEISSLLARRVREGTLTLAVATRLENDFLLHMATEYRSIQCDVAVINRARVYPKQYALRTLDSIQLACASVAMIILGTKVTFVSGDIRLLAAATAEGFAVDNPNNYP
jgi:hypothetical protein